jgi:carbonic anhydrase
MESHLKSTPPCSADKLLTSNILFKFKFIFQKRKFDYRNLTAAVQEAYRERGLVVHGWVLDIRNGKLTDLKINFEKELGSIIEIYNLGL